MPVTLSVSVLPSTEYTTNRNCDSESCGLTPFLDVEESTTKAYGYDLMLTEHVIPVNTPLFYTMTIHCPIPTILLSYKCDNVNMHRVDEICTLQTFTITNTIDAKVLFRNSKIT